MEVSVEYTGECSEYKHRDRGILAGKWMEHEKSDRWVMEAIGTRRYHVPDGDEKHKGCARSRYRLDPTRIGTTDLLLSS